MENEGSRRAGLITASGNASAAFQRLHDRLLQLEFDGYEGADMQAVLRAMETVLNAHRADPGHQPIEIFRELLDETIAEIDRAQPVRRM